MNSSIPANHVIYNFPELHEGLRKLCQFPESFWRLRKLFSRFSENAPGENRQSPESGIWNPGFSRFGTPVKTSLKYVLKVGVNLGGSIQILGHAEAK